MKYGGARYFTALFADVRHDVMLRSYGQLAYVDVCCSTFAYFSKKYINSSLADSSRLPIPARYLTVLNHIDKIYHSSRNKRLCNKRAKTLSGRNAKKLVAVKAD